MSGTGTWRRWVTPLARRAGLEKNPLRRGTDRAEAWIRIAALAVFLVGAPVAAVEAGNWTSSVAASSARAQASLVHRVPATLLQSAPASNPYSDRGGVLWVNARWTAPNGSRHTGEVAAQTGSRAGSVVQIWTDRAGHQASPPLSYGQAVSRTLTAVILAPLALALVLALALGLIHRLLERRRALAWENAWTAVEPLWTRRLR